MKRLEEISIDDAPINYDNDEAHTYASGYNSCVDKANDMISELKESFRKQLMWTKHMLMTDKGWTEQQFNDVFLRATSNGKR